MKIPFYIFLTCMALTSGCITEKTKELEKKSAQRSRSIHNVPIFYSAEAKENYNKGTDAREAGDFAAARLYYEKAYLLEPGHVLNLNNLASTCLMLEDFGTAEEYYIKALAQDPGYEITYINYSNFFMTTQRYEEGIKFVQKNRQKLKDREMQAYLGVNLALMYALTQQCAEAKNELEKARETVEGDPGLESIRQEIRENCP